MAQHWWLGTTSANSTVAANYSTAGSGGAPGVSVPGTGDLLTFDGGGLNPFTLFAAMALADLDMQAAYSSTIDLATFDLTMDDGGDVILAGGGTFDMGTGMMSITNGTFDFSGIGTLDDGSSTLEFDGVCNWISKDAVDLSTVTINAGATVTIPAGAGTFTDVALLLTADGTIDVASGKFFRIQTELIVGSSGDIDGDGSLRLNSANISAFAGGGRIQCAVMDTVNTCSLAAGTYEPGLCKFRQLSPPAATLTFDGPIVFTGDVEFETTGAGDYTIANDTNDPNIELQGDVIWDEQSGDIIYDAGEGEMSLTGMADVAIDFGGSSIEDLTIEKSAGIVTLGDDFTTDSFTGIETDAFDPNEKTINVLGDCDFAAAFTIGVFPYFGGSTWNIDGDFTMDGQEIDADIEWILNVTGSAIASGSGSIKNCNATGSPLIAIGWTDGGGNTNVVFGSPWYINAQVAAVAG